ncbi:chemotaxis response regulator protein-glutamate methylesterase [Microcoleus sp. EPA2]|uniref:protein-glutamate methylesterase/protein-glutamine glutaminase n=1 Tax=Microcoleus sp. EPA2 TaxID=2841654 RepID=UPI00312B4E1D
MPPIKILVVDKSVVVRRLLSNLLDADAALEVVGTAPNGKIALAKISQVNPDLIVLDLEKPEMEGLHTLVAIREKDKKIPVIMFSSLTKMGSSATLESLSLGATDYLSKPENFNSNEVISAYVREQLITKIKIICQTSLMPNLAPREVAEKAQTISPEAPKHQSPFLSPPPAIKNIKSQVEIVAVGASTGGPNALETVLSALPANFPVPIVIVQHMPPIFTKRLAERLAQKCQIRVEEGLTGGILAPGVAWIAPGDYHMLLERQGFEVQIRTNQDPPENSCRPAVDVLFRSTAKIYGAGVLAVVLTGMGQDGLHGCEGIREVGGQILVQDRASSVVWGMPGSVANSGLADRVVSLEAMAGEIIDRVTNNK